VEYIPSARNRCSYTSPFDEDGGLYDRAVAVEEVSVPKEVEDT
jgi:hypothetical protein